MKRVADGSRATIEGELGEIFGGLQTGIEEIAPKLKIVFEFVLPPVLFGSDDIAQEVSAAAAFALVLDLHPHAVVGEDHEIIRAGLRAFSGPERLQQAGGEGQETEQL